jgi:hypothetical protein
MISAASSDSQNELHGLECFQSGRNGTGYRIRYLIQRTCREIGPKVSLRSDSMAEGAVRALPVSTEGLRSWGRRSGFRLGI